MKKLHLCIIHSGAENVSRGKLASRRGPGVCYTVASVASILRGLDRRVHPNFGVNWDECFKQITQLMSVVIASVLGPQCLTRHTKSFNWFSIVLDRGELDGKKRALLWPEKTFKKDQVAGKNRRDLCFLEDGTSSSWPPKYVISCYLPLLVLPGSRWRFLLLTSTSMRMMWMLLMKQHYPITGMPPPPPLWASTSGILLMWCDSHRNAYYLKCKQEN